MKGGLKVRLWIKQGRRGVGKVADGDFLVDSDVADREDLCKRELNRQLHSSLTEARERHTDPRER